VAILMRPHVSKRQHESVSCKQANFGSAQQGALINSHRFAEVLLKLSIYPHFWSSKFSVDCRSGRVAYWGIAFAAHERDLCPYLRLQRRPRLASLVRKIGKIFVLLLPSQPTFKIQILCLTSLPAMLGNSKK